MFLDKLCIHQTDLDLKAAGIKNLGGFLDNSSSMLVLWGEDYFDRLWCNYELAVYIHLHGSSAVEMMPIKLAALGFGFCVVFFFQGVLAILRDAGLAGSSAQRWDSLSGGLVGVVLLVPYVMVGAFKANLYVARQTLKSTLATYDVRSSSCF